MGSLGPGLRQAAQAAGADSGVGPGASRAPDTGVDGAGPRARRECGDPRPHADLHPRAVSGHRTRRRALPAVQRNVPVRTFADWDAPLPGDMEADLVSHGGESAAGSFVHTLTLTDVASGWTECVALVVRDGALVVAALEQMRTSMPFPLRGFDTDNGGEFMNETVAAYCRDARDSVHAVSPVSQERSGVGGAEEWVRRASARRLPPAGGSRRRRGPLAPVRRLSALREFLSALLQIGVQGARGREGPEDVPRPRNAVRETPGLRRDPRRHEEASAAVALQLDPLRLLEEIRAVQHHLAELAAGHPAHLAPRHAGSLDGFLTGLATAWQQGEVRATHRLTPRPARDWRTRPIPSRPPGRACARGSRPSPTALGKRSSRDSRLNTPVSSPTASCARFSAGSRNGGTRPRVGWSSRRHWTPRNTGPRRRLWK